MAELTPALRDLLAAIRSKEAPRGYDQMYGPAEEVLGRRKLTTLRMDQVFDLQRRMTNVSASSAVGGYQFIRPTLAWLCTELDVKAEDKFTPELQDRMAMCLLERRGLHKFLAGTISREEFANNLAKEWASLPVVTMTRGANRWVEAGETYYAGDGLNKAFHDPQDILKLVDALKASPPANTPEAPGSPPQAPSEPQHTGIFALIAYIFKLIFGRTS